MGQEDRETYGQTETAGRIAALLNALYHMWGIISIRHMHIHLVFGLTDLL